MKKAYNILVFIIATLLFIMVYELRQLLVAEKAHALSSAQNPKVLVTKPKQPVSYLKLKITKPAIYPCVYKVLAIKNKAIKDSILFSNTKRHIEVIKYASKHLNH